jgi:uncharacterized protein
MSSIAALIAANTSMAEPGIAAALGLFDEGATLPFVARYRKERTGGLDEVQLRQIQELHRQITEVDQRRKAIIDALTKQGQLTPALQQALMDCRRKTELEDLYAPHKKRRKTKGDVAREAGLLPLAQRILEQNRNGHPDREAQRFVRGSINTVEQALTGARHIVAEEIAAEPDRRAAVRNSVGEHGMVKTAVKKGQDASKFRDYQEFSERAKSVPSHRYLAVCRGEQEGVLSVKVRPDMDRLIDQVLRTCRYDRHGPWAQQMELAVEDAVKRLLLPAAERAVRNTLKSYADDEAIDVFQKNLEALLLSAPLGPQRVLGIDPGIRTGCKCAIVSATGDFVAYKTIFLLGRKTPDESMLLAFMRDHRPSAVAVGNGTGGREAEAVVRAVVRDNDLPVVVVSVNEAGASVYSASELAGEELPDVDLTVRGAVSIARRLQDPLAELVKVDPKSIGVGQYQHDVDQGKLVRRLNEVVESCVNRVGVNVNTASPALLTHVAGLGAKRAKAVVTHRQQHGPFQRRRDLNAVPGLGRKTFEQCAGFLRVVGAEPLDNSAVHPERYKLVQQMARDLGVPVAELVGTDMAQRIPLSNYQDADTGMATLRDIAAELAKPGRDPREQFEAPEFRDDVRTLDDVQVGMELHGVVTNVTNFGAFVDIGVHQDGLVHISELADRFVKDPHAIVQAGKSVKVRVLEVDRGRERIALSMKTG